jgi:hypothetical protein
MAADDRKKRIMEHLSRSLGGLKFTSPKKTREPSAPSVPPPPPPTTPEPAPIVPKVIDRKRRIMEHVNRSSADFGDFSLEEKERKKQILDHIRKTQS